MIGVKVDKVEMKRPITIEGEGIPLNLYVKKTWIKEERFLTIILTTSTMKVVTMIKGTIITDSLHWTVDIKVRTDFANSTHRRTSNHVMNI